MKIRKKEMKNIFQIVFSILLFAGCANTISVRKRSDAINLCPYFSDSTDSIFRGKYIESLSKVSNKYSGFIKSTACDSVHYPSLKINIGKTTIATPGDRNLAIFISSVGITFGLALIASDSPFWLIFWHIPKNRTNVEYEYFNASINEKVKVKSELDSWSWYGSQELNFNKQLNEFRFDLQRQIDSIKVK
jgi:hypothetical protein